MKEKIRNIIISILAFIVCILLNYVFTDIGLKTNIMNISGIPYWLGSIIMCIGLPICIYFVLEDK